MLDAWVVCVVFTAVVVSVEEVLDTVVIEVGTIVDVLVPFV